MSICLLFDNDGTLVDSEYLSNLGFVKMFAPYGVSLDAHELVTRFKGNKINFVIDTIAEENNIKLDSDFIDKYRETVAELFEDQLKPIEGIHAALDQLDFPMAVVSSGPPNKIKQALRLCKLDDYFGDNIFSCYDIGIWKPEPAIYLHAAKTMGYSPENCYVIEDSMAGLAAGARAGMRNFFYNTDNIESPCQTITSFSSMHDLPDIIKSTLI